MAAATKLTKREMAAIVLRAEKAASEAFAGAQPSTMVVQQRENPMADLLGADPGAVVQEWVVPEGPCGFAWVTLRPATSRFARYLKSVGIGQRGYGGGLQLWYSELGIPSSQSYERNMAAANAYAAVLREAGLNAYGGGRLD